MDMNPFPFQSLFANMLSITIFLRPLPQCQTRRRLGAFRHHSSFKFFFNLLLIVLSIFLSNLQTVHSLSTGSPNIWKPTTTLRISRTIIASDCTQRASVVINGTSPGPELRYRAGQRIWIRVFNDLRKENTTIHWHGISQYGSPFSDGTSLSQYVIASGSFFDYEFQLPLESAGTYMYHGHINLDILSAYGALIVEAQEPPPYHYDGEITLLFADYFHSTDLEISSKLTSRPFTALTKPKSILVNGNALGECHPNGTTIQCQGDCHHHIIDVEPSKTYRVRAIGITTLSFLSIAIEGHTNLSFIEVDSHYVQKLDSDHLEIHSGQRYSFLLKTKSLAELDSYHNSSNIFWGRMETRWRPDRDHGTFILRYKTPPPLKVVDPGRISAPKDLALRVRLPDETVDWILDDLSPYSAQDVAPPASQVTRRIVFSNQQVKTAKGGIEWLVNGVAYSESSQLTPYLVAAYEKNTPLHPDYQTAAKNNGFDPKTSAFPIKYGEVVEMLVLNTASTAGTTEAHPWHFHGQSPYYIASGKGKFNSSILETAIRKRRGKPYQRDTLVLFTDQGATWKKPTSLLASGKMSGWFLVRMKATHVGAFMVHCHIALHMMMGMAASLLIGLEHLPQIPERLIEEYMTFNPKQQRNTIPTSYFDSLDISQRKTKSLTKVETN